MPSGSVGCLRWTQVGGEMNHWMGLDDAVMIKDDRIAVIKAQEHCRQEQNRKESLRRLQYLIRSAVVVPKRRKPSKPTRSSQRKRLDCKSKHAD